MPIFDIRNHIEFYDMLVDDFDDLMREQHSARRAFHCILEAYHLREWIWHGLVENDPLLKEKLIVTNEKEFNTLIDRRFLWFPYLKDLTNGSKHFEERARGFEVYRVAAAPFSFEFWDAGSGQGAWDGPVRYVSGSLPVGQDNKGYLMFDFGEGAGEHRYLPVLHVVEAVVRFWRDTLRFLQHDASIRSSVHHNER